MEVEQGCQYHLTQFTIVISMAKLIFLKRFCFVRFSLNIHINYLLMLYKWIYVIFIEEWTPIVLISDHILQVPHNIWRQKLKCPGSLQKCLGLIYRHNSHFGPGQSSGWWGSSSLLLFYHKWQFSHIWNYIFFITHLQKSFVWKPSIILIYQRRWITVH